MQKLFISADVVPMLGSLVFNIATQSCLLVTSAYTTDADHYVMQVSNDVAITQNNILNMQHPERLNY